ncbi:MAG: hypothetical protein GY707_10850, partial [Desulfobacteraceae bacterium]|nr:hypothetical protein [Desulfobacteraceae bacterium]
MEKNNNPLKFINKILVSIFDLIFPLKCLKCQKIIFRCDQDFAANLFEKYFCSDCISLKYEPFEPPFCKKCGVKFDHDYANNHHCEACLNGSSYIGKVRAGARYSGIVKESIQAFKYQKKLALTDPLG